MSLESTQAILNIVLPVFIIIGTGFFFGRVKSIDLHSVNELILYIATPCLIISSLSRFPLELDLTWKIFVCVAGVIVVSMLVGLILTRLMKLPVRIYVPTLMFANTGNMGLPLILFAFGQAAFNNGIIYMVSTTLMHYTMGIVIVNTNKNPLEVFKLPLIYSTLAGILISIFYIEIPVPVDRSLELLGDIAIPAMIFSLGYKLSEIRITNVAVSFVFGTLRIVMGFCLGMLFVELLDLKGLAAKVVILQASMPPAVFNFVLAEKYNLDSRKVASIIMAGTISSLFILPFIISYLLGL